MDATPGRRGKAKKRRVFRRLGLREREKGKRTLGVGSEEERDEQEETEERAEGDLHLPAEVGERDALLRVEGGDQQEVHQFAYQNAEGDGQLEGGANAA